MFAAYSNRALIAVLGRRMGLPFKIARSKSRTIRALWFMRQLGGGWLSLTDLASAGAGTWRAMKWLVPDGVKDGFIEETIFDGWKTTRYKITATGIRLVEEADRFVREEMERSLLKCSAFRAKHGINGPK